jgi:hypothetical protein
MVRLSRLGSYKDVNREFKLRVIRQTANARQRKILRYQAIKSINELAVLKLEYVFFRRKKENMKRKRSTKLLPRKFEPAVCRSRKREA